MNILLYPNYYSILFILSCLYIEIDVIIKYINVTLTFNPIQVTISVYQEFFISVKVTFHT